MSLIFLSRTLRPGLAAYNGDPEALLLTKLSDMDKGATANAQRLTINGHVGTHLDFPRHFLKKGKTMDDYRADYFFFHRPALIEIPLDTGELIKAQDVDGWAIDPRADLLLIRTGYSKFYEQDKYWNDNPGLAASAAESLKSRYPALRAVGLDTISINAFKFKDEGRRAHRLLLAEPEILIIEDMDLSPIGPGALDWVLAAPLPVAGADGVPVSVFANTV